MNLLGVAPAFAQTSANKYGSNPALAATEPPITLATTTTSIGGQLIGSGGYARNPSAQTPLTTAQKIALLRTQVKYVFVLFQENRAFDHYFGTYPGANGLYSTFPGANPADPYAQPGNATVNAASFTQNILNSTDTYSTTPFSTQTPFLVPRTIVNQAQTTVQLYPESIFSVDHTHAGYMNDFHYDAATKSTVKNDGYALDQEAYHYSTDASTTATVVNSGGTAPTAGVTLSTKQKGQIVMAHVDCDTIPFLWQFADRFTLFDNFHQTATGPSTPNAIALLAGQVGDTQWVKHPTQADPTGLSLPVLADTVPFPGSTGDSWAGKPPFGLDDGSYNASTNTLSATSTTEVPLTFASLGLSFMGSQIGTITAADQHKASDLVDVLPDLQAIAAKNSAVSWGWYEQGFGPEPIDGTSTYIDNDNFTTSGAPVHASLITHHVGPQYFGYLADNSIVYQPQNGYTTPNQPGNLHGLAQFYTDVQGGALPASGGVFYVRGGYANNDGLVPADPNPTIKHTFVGNDDHGSYSDSQISEALVADSVNAIANSPYWNQSAIIITYDESDGFFDHQPEDFRTYGPDGKPETGGPRIPTIVISPFAVAHGVSHVYSEHSSVIKFIEEVYGLTALGNLPSESAAFITGANNCSKGTNLTFCAPNATPQTTLGPADVAANMGDLTEAFDNDRLLIGAPSGYPTANPAVTLLPASYAVIGNGLVGQANPTIATLPHYVNGSTFGCQVLSIVPTDYPSTGYAVGAEIDPPPLDFNPRPTASPGSPYYNTNSGTSLAASTGQWAN
jgi:phospholipase C